VGVRDADAWQTRESVRGDSGLERDSIDQIRLYGRRDQRQFIDDASNDLVDSIRHASAKKFVNKIQRKRSNRLSARAIDPGSFFF
jgi:predicted HicB family RNase H-like nuclease